MISLLDPHLLFFSLTLLDPPLKIRLLGSTLFVFLSKFYDVIFADSVYLKVMCEYVYNLFEQ
jgi:hypothetical protein